jgi:hypothetical protein
MRLSRETALKVYLASLWLVCLYRAITQSIVHDEALTYQLYLAGPAARIFDLFDANHHFLNTLLMKVSVSLFGLSEWSMRLPALAGAALYFAAVYRIGTRHFRTVAASLLMAGLLTLNPLILDFMVAARGYGMALGMLLWALAILLDHLRDPASQSPWDLLLGGAALGLSIAANLVFLVPAAVLAGLALLLEQKPKPADTAKKKPRKREETRARASLWKHFVPAACGVAVGLFLTAPLDQATSANFYVGAGGVTESLRNLAQVSLAHSGPLRHTVFVTRLGDAIAFVLAPAVLLAALVIGVRRSNALLLLTAGTATGAALILIVMNLAMDFPYPVDRTGLYFLAFTPAALAGLLEAGEGRVARVVAVGGQIAGVLLILLFALQFNTRKFLVWDYDADTRRIVNQIAQAVGKGAPGSVRIRNSWQLEPSLNFYRERDHLTWMNPATRDPLGPGGDYYAVIPSDASSIATLHLRRVYEGPVSGTILAVPEN